MAGRRDIFMIQICSLIVSVYSAHTDHELFDPEPDPDLANVALGKMAYQSDTDSDKTADKAVDGYVPPHGLMNEETCSLTRTKTKDAYWEVDLGHMYLIDHLEVYDQSGCCDEMLRDVLLYIGMKSTNYKLQGYGPGITLSNFKTFQMEQPVLGKWVKITKNSSITAPLSVCEAKVFGELYLGEWIEKPAVYNAGKFWYSACKEDICKQLDVTKVRREKSSSWPPGPYAIPISNDDVCPETESHGWKKGIFAITAPSDGKNLSLTFCVKIERDQFFAIDKGDWMSGTYSIYMSGPTCPEGFVVFNQTVEYETFSYSGHVSNFSIDEDSGGKHIVFYMCGRNPVSEIDVSHTELREKFKTNEDCKLVSRTGVPKDIISCFDKLDDKAFELTSDAYITSWIHPARLQGGTQFEWYQIDLRRTLIVSDIEIMPHVMSSHDFFKLVYKACFYANVKHNVLDAASCNETVLAQESKLRLRHVQARYITLQFNESNISQPLLSKESIKIFISELPQNDICNEDLGMEDGSIQDFQITASSWLLQYLPSAARPLSDGWCADVIDPNPWILVDLITHIRVEGLSVWITGQHEDKTFENGTGCMLFDVFYGLDRNTLVPHNDTHFYAAARGMAGFQTFMFSSSFEARYVKLEIRHCYDINSSCLRFELQGCKLSGIPTLDCPNGYMFELDREIRSEVNPVIHRDTHSLENCSALCLQSETCSVISYSNEEHCIEYPSSKIGMWQIGDSITGKWSAKLCHIDYVELFPSLQLSTKHWFTSGTITNVEYIKHNSIISSIGYPFSYGNGQNYKWLISYPDNHYIRIVFTNMSLGHVDEGCLDRLLVSATINTTTDMTEINRKYNDRYFVIETEETLLFLTFNSCNGQRKVTNRGFRAIVTGEGFPACFSLDEQWRDESDLFCEVSQMFITSMSILNLPFVNVEEVWKIDVSAVASVHHTLEIHMIDFYVMCQRGSIFSVIEMKEERTFCNTDVPLDTIYLRTFTVILKFRKHDDDKNVYLRTEGFRLRYSIIDHAVKHLIDYTDAEYKACSKTFGKCYHLNIGLKTWIEASELCRKCNQTLVSVQSEYEMQFVNYLLRDHKEKIRLSGEDSRLKEYTYSSHIGSRRIINGHGKKTYVWENASPITYFPWKPDNPVVDKDCTRTNFQFITNRTWESEDCITDISLFYICQSSLVDDINGVEGESCAKYEHLVADIVFGIRSTTFESSYTFYQYGGHHLLMRLFLEELVNMFEIGPHAIQIAAIVMSDIFDIPFYLNDIKTTEDAIKKIRKIEFQHSTEADIGDALWLLHTIMFMPMFGGRDSVPRIGVLLIDGDTVDLAEMKHEANLAKDAGIKLIVVGIGDVNDEDLKDIVSAPTFENYIHVEDHFGLAFGVWLEIYRKISVIDAWASKAQRFGSFPPELQVLATKNRCKYVVWNNWKFTETINKTFSGTLCQSWATLTEKATLDFELRFPGIAKPSQAHNYCQDPASSGILWCYATGSGRQLWEPCFLQLMSLYGTSLASALKIYFAEALVGGRKLTSLESKYNFTENTQRNRSNVECEDSKNIHGFDVCDGVFNCNNFSDATSCRKRGQYLTSNFSNIPIEQPPERLTRGLYFLCGSDEWISLLAKCDDVIDCVDASDELDCAAELIENTLSCDDGDCQECDFTSAYTSAEEELREFRECESSEYKCKNKQCISMDKRCNAIVDCIDGTDESKCESCKDSLHCDMVKCIPLRLKCDRYLDCDNGADENTCVYESLSSCDEWWEHGYHTSGQYVIDGIVVHCDFTSIAKTGMIMFVLGIDVTIDKDIGKMYTRALPDNLVEFNTPSFRNLIYRDGYSCFLEVQRTCEFSVSASIADSLVDNDGFQHCQCMLETFKAEKAKLFSNLESTNEYSFSRNKTFNCNGTETARDPISSNGYYNVTGEGYFYVDGRILNRELQVPMQITPKRITCTYDYRIPPSMLCIYDVDSVGIMTGYRLGGHLQNCDNFVCPKNTVKCPGSYCLPLRLVCDGDIQCPGGEDEYECSCTNTARDILVFVEDISDSEESKIAAIKLAEQFYTTSSDIRLLFFQTQTPLKEYDIEHRLLEIREEQIYLSKRVDSPGECRYKSMARNLLGNIKFTSNSTKGIIFIEDSLKSSKVAELMFANMSEPAFTIYRVLKDANFTVRHTVPNMYRFVKDVPIHRWNTLYSIGYKKFPEICQAATEVPCSGGYRCSSSKQCIPLDQVCDGIAQCHLKDDERLCDFLCPHHCTCIGFTIDCRAANLIYNDTKMLSLNIRIADMSQNQELKYVLTKSMFRFSYLTKLNMSACEIGSVNKDGFSYLSKLKCLDIGYNKINILPDKLFGHLESLVFLNLDGNFELQVISPTAFNGLKSLKHLRITGTKLRRVSSFTFTGLSLQYINISYNEITEIEDNAFNGTSVGKIDFRGNNILSFNRRIFAGISSLQELHSSAFKFCCIRPCTIEESNCFPQENEFSSCADLMRHPVLQAVLWIVGITALVGNIGSILYRIFYDQKRLKIGYGIFVTNLAGADFLMGVYLIMIAIADSIYRDRYIYVDDEWRHSKWCVTAGILSTVSSEASVIFVCLITLDRLLVIKYPFGTIRLDPRKAYICCIASWAVALLIAVIPVVFTGYFENKFYSRSAVCVALPLTRDKPPGWMYSVSIFVCLNFFTFFLVAFGQISIFCELQKATEGLKKTQQSRKRDLQVARNLIIVATSDFLCWFPVGLMGLLALNGYPISGDVYAWTSVFILPLNSALNPILYTLGEIIVKQRSDPNIEQESKIEIQKEKGSVILRYQHFIRSVRLKSDLARLGKCVRELQQGNEPISSVTVIAICFHLSQYLCILHESSVGIDKLSANTTYVKVNRHKTDRVNIIVDSKISISNDEKILTENIYQLGLLLRGLTAKCKKIEDKLA